MKDKTILIVEDEESNYLYLKNLLKASEVTIIWVNSGLEAIRLFSVESKVDLVIMDIKMPKLDGYDILKELRSLQNDLIVIAHS